jgi:signal transduction histidine kinase/CheY-like chemotaxis protein
MNIKNLTIGTQLRLGLGAILLLVAALGVVAYVQTDVIHQQAEIMYQHPLQVRRALANLEADVLKMQLGVRDLMLATRQPEKLAARVAMDVATESATQQFTVLEARYLGPRADIDAARTAFVKWRTVRDEWLMKPALAGEIEAAKATLLPGGPVGKARDELLAAILKIDDFAKNKGDELYATSRETSEALNRQLILIVAAILLLSLGIAWLLLNGIRRPLANLTTATDQFRAGKLDSRSPYTSANEFGMLAASFNSMADAIQTQVSVSENVARLAGVMLRDDELPGFCRELLKALLEHTGSQVAAVYLLNEAQTAFAHFDSIGLGASARAEFSATELEGELGAAVATRRIQRISAIPADSRFAFSVVSGEFQPRDILTIPVLSDHTVVAVISLASVRAFEAPALRLVDDIWATLTARVNGVLAFRKINALAQRLEHQNRELDAQKHELSAQADELVEQNTELGMQKRSVDEASRLKSAFLSNMSHELRTPLNSVIALSGVLGRRLAGKIGADEYGYLEVIERNGKNLLALINDILDLQRIEAGREELSVSRFAVRDLAGELVAMLETQAQAQAKGIALLNNVPADLPPMTSDPVKCRHILQNLVGNAVKFTEQGQVSITAEVVQAGGRASEIRIAVSDTGIGIAADALAYIFEEFRQADDSTSRQYGGTGLGLSIAQKYAHFLGGGITVESVPGQGSTFTVWLPLVLSLPGDATADAASPPARPLAGAHAAAPTAAGRGQNILVVEDNEAAIIQLTDILQAQGYCLQVAHNGREALVQIGQSVPDALILDLMMPEVDGFAVLQAIREVPRSSKVPVLILTAKHVTRDELSFLKSNNIHQLIQKGDINRDGLLAAVAGMLAPPPATPATPAAPSRQRRLSRPGKPLVLVVEDNPDNLRTARALLADDYQVIEATDGRAGVEQARAQRPDIILMDIGLPVMDGLQALEEIRADENLRPTPVLAVTASAMKGDRESILAHGFDGYLSKPIDRAELMGLMQQLLGPEHE